VPGAPATASLTTDPDPQHAHPDPTPLRVGVVGLGFAGTTHLDAYRAVRGVEVVALAGKERQRLAELASSRQVPHTYEDWEDLVARDDLDAVSIGTPNHLHHPIAVAALSSGKHVLCEKPMATTGDLAAEMVAAAQQADRVLEIAFNHRRRADVQFLRRYLDDQPLGAIYHARARWTRRTGIPGIDSWFTSKTMAGGGALIDLGSHVLDIALHLLGEPRVTRASGVTYNELGRAGRGGERNAGKTGATGHLFDVEDFASALLRLDNGRSLHLEASWAGYTNDHDDIGIDLLGDRGGVRLYGENYAAAGTVTIYSDIDGHRVTSRPEIATPSVGHGVVVQGFVDTIRSGQWQASHGEYGLHRSRVLDAVYESAREGTEVAVK